MIRLSDSRPVCSACHTQHLDGRRFVDFYADHDGGFSREGVSLDDLIICEACVKMAGILVGFGDLDEQAARVKSLELAFEREKYRADELEKYAGDLELAFDQRPERIVHPRKRGRPATREQVA